MTTAQQELSSPTKTRHYEQCMARLEKKLAKTGFDEAMKQTIRTRESDRWHLLNDDVPARYFNA